MLKKRGAPITGFFGKHKFAMAVTTLIGTIVGAGILGIPYVVAKAGIFYGFVLMIAIGFAFVFLNLFAGEVVLRTKKQYQLTGYAEKYLGRTGKRIMTFSMVFNIYGALTAYLIGEGQTLFFIFGAGFPLLYTLLFFAVTSFIVYKGIKATGRAELILISLLFLVVILIGIFSFRSIDTHNFTPLDLSYFFLPYGVILFAFMGSPAIPEVQEVLGQEKKKMKKAIIIGSVIPIVLYLLFTIIIIGVVGEGNFDLLAPNERIATIALSVYGHPLLGTLANLLAVLSMFTSFLTLSIALAEMYEYDYSFSRRKALLFTLSLPLIIILLNATTFFTVLGLTGAIAGGLDGIIITLMYWKAKTLGDRKPEYVLGKHTFLGSVLILMFILGLVYQLKMIFF